MSFTRSRIPESTAKRLLETTMVLTGTSRVAYHATSEGCQKTVTAAINLSQPHNEALPVRINQGNPVAWRDGDGAGRNGNRLD